MSQPPSTPPQNPLDSTLSTLLASPKRRQSYQEVLDSDLTLEQPLPISAKLFYCLDTDCDGRLDARELRVFANVTGFDEAEVSWSDAYDGLCNGLNLSPEEAELGLTKEVFAELCEQYLEHEEYKTGLEEFVEQNWQVQKFGRKMGRKSQNRDSTTSSRRVSVDSLPRRRNWASMGTSEASLEMRGRLSEVSLKSGKNSDGGNMRPGNTSREEEIAIKISEGESTVTTPQKIDLTSQIMAEPHTGVKKSGESPLVEAEDVKHKFVFDPSLSDNREEPKEIRKVKRKLRAVDRAVAEAEGEDKKEQKIEQRAVLVKELETLEIEQRAQQREALAKESKDALEKKEALERNMASFNQMMFTPPPQPEFVIPKTAEEISAWKEMMRPQLECYNNQVENMWQNGGWVSMKNNMGIGPKGAKGGPTGTFLPVFNLNALGGMTKPGPMQKGEGKIMQMKGSEGKGPSGVFGDMAGFTPDSGKGKNMMKGGPAHMMKGGPAHMMKGGPAHMMKGGPSFLPGPSDMMMKGALPKGVSSSFDLMSGAKGSFGGAKGGIKGAPADYFSGKDNLLLKGTSEGKKGPDLKGKGKKGKDSKGSKSRNKSNARSSSSSNGGPGFTLGEFLDFSKKKIKTELDLPNSEDVIAEDPVTAE